MRARLVLSAALLVFLLHAANYLYFFVDDEGIPYVYAQNVLEGHGLAYNADDGPVEGYSDFLQVWLGVIVLALTRALHEPKVSVFFVGKAISLACALAIIWLAATLYRRWWGPGTRGLAATVGLLALAGPLAVWSCSSLEAVRFALIVLLFLLGVLEAGASARGDLVVSAVGIALLLERIDGFVYCGIVLAAAIAWSEPPARRAILRRVVPPIAIALVAYHGWRAWHFGSLLNLPVQAKVLFKLTSLREPLVMKLPERNYLVRFLALYGFVPVVVVAAGAWVARRDRALRVIVSVLVAAMLYLALVGDWMFGFRFFVPVLPLLALVVGALVARAESVRPAIAPVLVAAVLAGAGVTAYGLDQDYVASEQHPNWLAHPRGGLEAYFGRYYVTSQQIAAMAHPGDTMAFNQSGFVPFVTDLPNIDNLGICTPFFARLPTVDVFFTEVGRYSPLTNAPALRASDAYLLYRRPTFLVEPGDLARGANRGRVPPAVLGDRYEVRLRGPNAVYVPAGTWTFEEFRRDPSLFRENVAHVSSARRIVVDGREVDRRVALTSCAYLVGRSGVLAPSPTTVIEVRVGHADVPVFEIYVGSIRASAPITIEVLLHSTSGAIVFSHAFDVAREIPATVIPVGTDVHADRFAFIVRSQQPGTTVRVEDLRVQGQSPRLRAFLDKTAFTR